jgi:hypothetical protein
MWAAPTNEPGRAQDGPAREETQRTMQALTVAATTRPFLERAVRIVDETWRGLDRVADALDRHAVRSEQGDDAVLEPMTSGIRELARRLEQVEAAPAAQVPVP